VVAARAGERVRVMNQPVARYNPEDLERIIERDFEPSSVSVARALLSRYGQESWHREVLRVRMACLKCAEGDLAALKREVEDACCDYRDVLVAAEYPRYAGAKDDEGRKRSIEDDWRELQEWLNRK
jgi:hypothetical protein